MTARQCGDTRRAHGLIVVTLNVKDFGGRGVKVIDAFKVAHRRAGAARR